MVRKSVILLGVVVASLGLVTVAAPAIAATGGSYIPGTEDAISTPIAAPGQDIVYETRPSFFIANEPVAFTVSGENGSAITGVVYSTSPVLTKPANADGSFSATFQLPPGASGAYSVEARGLESGVVGTQVVTAAAAVTGGKALASTGGEVDTSALFLGGGALALGAAGVAFAVRRRRSVA